jgi:hypothetical protein
MLLCPREAPRGLNGSKEVALALTVVRPPATIATASASAGSPNAVKRENGITVFPAARTQSSLPSNLAEGGAKSTAPVQDQKRA